jgi:predicted RND superfamily exporter protein
MTRIFNNSEFEEVNYELYDEIEEEFMEHMDKLIAEDKIEDEEDFIIEGKSIIESLQFVYDDLEAEKIDIERKILLNMINAYGISIINENYNIIQNVFDKLNLDFEIEKLYEVSEDKKISDYKEWYNKLFKLTGRNLKKEINN